MAKKNVGSSFDDFLEDEGILEETTAVEVKRVIAFQLAEKMSESNLTKSEMARRMETSRSAVQTMCQSPCRRCKVLFRHWVAD